MTSLGTLNRIGQIKTGQRSLVVDVPSSVSVIAPRHSRLEQAFKMGLQLLYGAADHLKRGLVSIFSCNSLFEPSSHPQSKPIKKVHLGSFFHFLVNDLPHSWPGSVLLGLCSYLFLVLGVILSGSFLVPLFVCLEPFLGSSLDFLFVTLVVGSHNLLNFFLVLFSVSLVHRTLVLWKIKAPQAFSLTFHRRVFVRHPEDYMLPVSIQAMPQPI